MGKAQEIGIARRFTRRSLDERVSRRQSDTEVHRAWLETSGEERWPNPLYYEECLRHGQSPDRALGESQGAVVSLLSFLQRSEAATHRPPCLNCRASPPAPAHAYPFFYIL